VTSAQYEFASEVRAEFSDCLASLLDDNTVIAMSSMPDVAPLISVTDSELDVYRFEAIRLLCVSGLSGCPQVSMPIMRIQGVPLGFSLVGPRGSDAALLSLAVTISC
jgi:amidase